MVPATTDPIIRTDLDAVLTHFDTYDWANDTDFQAGIAGIVQAQQSQGATEPEIEATINRAKAFYYSSKVGHSISYDDYLVWKSQQPIPPEASQPESEAANGTSEEQATQQGEPYPPSFDAIVELISTGRTDEIPGIKDIPLQINEEPPTEAVLPKRRKPWEAALQSQPNE